MGATLAAIVAYGIVRGRGSKNISGYFLADRSMRWYTVALSIMATQASAVTFTSAPGQAYADGMRFVQYYFGLPIAMVILSVTAVPIFHRLKVFTAYEYLEHRFDLKTRTLTSIIFLIQRGLGVGITIYAPSLVLSVVLGWSLTWTSVLIGGTVILYTTSGGVKSVNWTDMQQMLVIMGGMALAFVMTILLLPKDISFTDALTVAGGMGRLNVIDFSFDPNNRYTLFSGIIGGMFVALAYFGTDQSQVQRYLTGRSVTQSRLGLLFNGIAKVPMQFLILLLGVMVFVFYQFVTPPIFFNPVERERVAAGPSAGAYAALEGQYGTASEEKSMAIRAYLQERRAGTESSLAAARKTLEEKEAAAQAIRAKAVGIIRTTDPSADPSDTNYIFLTFVLSYLPAGLVGLVFACIFAASMSSSSGELSALASCTIVDIYKRHIRPAASDRHYLFVSRGAMALWGVYAIAFAQFASRLGSLIEAVNIIGSLFYGTMLGIFLLAFYLKFVRGTAVFCAAFVGEAVVLYCFLFTGISWLWYNVVGCLAAVASAALFEALLRRGRGEGGPSPRPTGS